MVKVQSRWQDDEKDWYLAKVVDFAPGEWIQVHYWRSHGDSKNNARTYSPVWLNRKGDREACLLNPKGQGGFKNARAGVDWLKPMADAVQAVAVCMEVKGGVKVRSWCEVFTF